jgi:hypothetical protein
MIIKSMFLILNHQSLNLKKILKLQIIMKSGRRKEREELVKI